MTLRASLGVALVLGLAAVPVALAKTTTIKVTSNTISLRQSDIGPKGASKGDTISYRDHLVNAVPQFGKKKGALVGSDTGKLTFTSAHTATFKGTVTLPGGTLRVSGLVHVAATGDVVLKVTKGTGSFAGLHGTLTVGSGRYHALNTYSLTTAHLTGPVA